ncbi:MAG: glutathione-disulfide reductase [Hyphomicrobiaceae bacterium]|nr:glutathione-disulfide reductase [Hyphomicrobiaceae bacterium]
MSDFDYDLFVIGAGSGGVRAARIAAGHGAKVAIAEEFRTGGTCVIRGCVPKKLLVYASRFRDEFEDAAGFGWNVPEPSFDWATLIANKDGEIARLEGLYKAGLQRAGAKLIASRATVTGPNAVRIEATGETVRARTILIATGGRPVVPQVAGAEHAITSNEAFHLEALPKSIVIVGGGYIALEFAGIFSSLGAETTVLYRGEKILRGFDEDVRDHLTSELVKRGIDIVTQSNVAAIDKGWNGLDITLVDGRKVKAGALMFASGRAPNTRGLGLEAAGVALGERGEVKVDAHSRTNIPSIYAVGDVTDRVNLTPVAIREGHAFADTVFGNRPATVSHDMIPTAVFTTPEVGTVGMPEHEARKRHPKLDVYKASFRPMRHTLSGRDERTLMKLLVDGEGGRVVGCHIVGPDAGEIVQMAAIAMRMGATKADFDATMALHPSAAEELVTMREKWVPPKPAA